MAGSNGIYTPFNEEMEFRPFETTKANGPNERINVLFLRKPEKRLYK